MRLGLLETCVLNELKRQSPLFEEIFEFLLAEAHLVKSFNATQGLLGLLVEERGPLFKEVLQKALDLATNRIPFERLREKECPFLVCKLREIYVVKEAQQTFLEVLVTVARDNHIDALLPEFVFDFATFPLVDLVLG